MLLALLLIVQVTSEKKLRKELQQHFKTDMSEKKALIKEHVSTRTQLSPGTAAAADHRVVVSSAGTRFADTRHYRQGCISNQQPRPHAQQHNTPCLWVEKPCLAHLSMHQAGAPLCGCEFQLAPAERLPQASSPPLP